MADTTTPEPTPEPTPAPEPVEEVIEAVYVGVAPTEAPQASGPLLGLLPVIENPGTVVAAPVDATVPEEPIA